MLFLEAAQLLPIASVPQSWLHSNLFQAITIRQFCGVKSSSSFVCKGFHFSNTSHRLFLDVLFKVQVQLVCDGEKKKLNNGLGEKFARSRHYFSAFAHSRCDKSKLNFLFAAVKSFYMFSLHLHFSFLLKTK